MRKLIEKFISLFINQDKLDAIKKEALADTEKAIVEFKNKAYFDKLSKNATKKRIQ